MTQIMRRPDEYNFHHPFSSLRREVLAPFAELADVFIETGSNVGLGIATALDCGFETIYSIEAVPDLFAICQQRFRNEPQVKLYRGDSPVWLKVILETIDVRAVIYLDAHSAARNPLLEELEVIRACGHHDHIILIDDVRMFDTPEWHGLKKSDAFALLKQINPSYDVTYRDTPNALNDLMVAMP